MKKYNFFTSLFMYSITIWGIHRFYDDKGFYVRKGFYWYFSKDINDLIKFDKKLIE